MKKPAKLATALVGTALLAAACTPSEPEAPVEPTPTVAESSSEPEPAPSSSAPEPSPSPSPVQSFPAADAEETEEQAAIREGWEKYEAELDRYMKDPELTDLTALQATTTGQESIDAVNEIVDMRMEGVVREGDISFRNLQIHEPEVNDSGVNVAVLEVCKDFTQQRQVDAETGEPIEAEEGQVFAETVQARLTMEQLPAGNWVVAGGEWEQKQC